MCRSSAPLLLAAAAYALLTVALTWPLAAHPGSLVPNDLGDPLLTTWMVWWNATALPLTETWWNAPQFFPSTGTFAFSEHLLGLAPITTPIILLTGNPLLAHNTAFLLTFFLSALAAHFLAFTIIRRHDLAFVAGIAYAFAPYRLPQIPHIQVLSSYWMPLSLAGLHRYFRVPRLKPWSPGPAETTKAPNQARWLVLFAGAWLMQALACTYYVFFLSVLIGLWLAWFALRRAQTALVLKALVAWCIAGLLLAPVLWGYFRVSREYRFQRTLTEIRQFSADVASVLKAWEHSRFWSWLHVISRPESDLFPGLTVVVIAAAGLVLAWRARTAARTFSRTRRVLFTGAALAAALAIARFAFGPFRVEIGGLRLFSVTSPEKPISIAVLCLIVVGVLHPAVRESWRRQSVLGFYALATFVMWVMALGPEPTLMEQRVLYKPPYSWFMLLPGAEGIRVPARFWMLAVLCLSVTAALGLGLITRKWRRSSRWLPAVVVAGLLIDVWPTHLRMLSPPPARPNHAAADLRLDLPLGAGTDTQALYRSTLHRRPLLNGYSGYFPPHYGSLHELLFRKDPAALSILATLGSIEVMVEHSGDPEGAWRQLMTRAPGATVVYSAAEYTSYLVPRRVEERRDPQGARAPYRISSATTNAALAPLVQDGDLTTRWFVSREEAGRHSITIELDSPAEVNRVELSLGSDGWHYPRELLIETSVDGQAWSHAWQEATTALVLAGALERPRSVPISISFGPVPTRFIRLTEMSADDYDWSLAELRVFRE